LQDLSPLYQAIPHGCRAGRHREVFENVYRKRLSRINKDGSDQCYTIYDLGATSTDLSAISWFFDRPFEEPVAGLTTSNRRRVLWTSAICLLSQGRFAEAQSSIQLALETGDNRNLEEVLSLTSLLGNIAYAIGDLKHAKMISMQTLISARQTRSQMSIAASLTVLSEMLVASGEFEVARRNMIEVKQLEMQHFQGRKRLGSETRISDAVHSELLLIKGDFAGARTSANRGLRSIGGGKLLYSAFLKLKIGQATHGLALGGSHGSNESRRADEEKRQHANAALSELDEAIERLQITGRADVIPSGYRARSALRRSIGDWEGAARDINEIREIADVGPKPMKLHLCDLALERARLAFAKIEAFAPLNGMLEEDDPPKPAVPNAEEIAKLKSDAAEQLRIAADYIETCGYHRRDEELAELQAVLRGEKKFADLPPRV
jgi:tetratricopeptide (TPR) repeat protein